MPGEVGRSEAASRNALRARARMAFDGGPADGE